jgi:phosphoserine aminotransferase
MVCFEDYIDALKWAKRIGGLEGLIARSMRSFGHIQDFVAKNDWIEFLAKDPKVRTVPSKLHSRSIRAWKNLARSAANRARI